MKLAILLYSIVAIYRAKSKVSLSLIFVAALSFCSFLNFGHFHFPRNEKIHYWDAFHYYIGAKYFQELGYTSLYNSTYIAGNEKGLFQEITAVRELNSYELIPVKLIDPAKIKARFSEERWRMFSDDILFFIKESNRPDSAWQKLLVDHGYNAPPFKTAVMSFILNLYPLNNLTLAFTVGLDYLMIFALIIACGVTLGWYEACIFTIAFSWNPLAPFDYTFGSIMRYDWFLFLGLALLAALKNKFTWCGLLLALSTQCRIFPLIFALTLATAIIKERKKLVRFISSYAITCLICFGLSLMFTGNIRIFEEFSQKMAVHSEKIFSNTVGIRQVMLTDHALYYERGKGFTEEELSEKIKTRRTLTSLLGLFISAFALLLTKGTGILRSFVSGMLIIFSLVNPVNYYYAFLAFLTFNKRPIFLLFMFLLGQLPLMFEGNLLVQSIYFSLLTGLILIFNFRKQGRIAAS